MLSTYTKVYTHLSKRIGTTITKSIRPTQTITRYPKV